MINTKSDARPKSKLSEFKSAPLQQRTESLQSSPRAHVLDAATPPTEEVAALAYQLWVERGSPHGSHEEDWYRAEEQLRNRHALGRSASV